MSILVIMLSQITSLDILAMDGFGNNILSISTLVSIFYEGV
jgi:hypothetical protein